MNMYEQAQLDNAARDIADKVYGNNIYTDYEIAHDSFIAGAEWERKRDKRTTKGGQEVKLGKYGSVLQNMEDDILNILAYVKEWNGEDWCERKQNISKETTIPEYILTPILKKLEDEGKIKSLTTFNEDDGLANGRGYCLK